MSLGDAPAALAFILDYLKPVPEALGQLTMTVVWCDRLRCMELLQQRGLLGQPWMGLSCFVAAAADGQQLATAQWLIEHLSGEQASNARQQPLTAEVFRQAACFGDLPLLQLLRQRGCPWDG